MSSREDDLYDLVEPAPPRRGRPVATLPASHAYQSLRDAKNEPDGYFPDKTIDFHLPLILLTVGIGILYGAALLGWLGAAITIPRLGARLAGGTTLLLVGALIAAHFRGIELGKLPARS
jgi:hypothetical protein